MNSVIILELSRDLVLQLQISNSLIIFDKYEVASGNSGDVFTCTSYGAADTRDDIPSLPNGVRVTDLIDFRPRVKPFDITTNASPFGFSSRQYESRFQICNNSR